MPHPNHLRGVNPLSCKRCFSCRRCLGLIHGARTLVALLLLPFGQQQWFGVLCNLRLPQSARIVFRPCLSLQAGLSHQSNVREYSRHAVVDRPFVVAVGYLSFAACLQVHPQALETANLAAPTLKKTSTKFHDKKHDARK